MGCEWGIVRSLVRSFVRSPASLCVFPARSAASRGIKKSISASGVCSVKKGQPGWSPRSLSFAAAATRAKPLTARRPARPSTRVRPEARQTRGPRCRSPCTPATTPAFRMTPYLCKWHVPVRRRRSIHLYFGMVRASLGWQSLLQRGLVNRTSEPCSRPMAMSPALRKEIEGFGPEIARLATYIGYFCGRAARQRRPCSR